MTDRRTSSISVLLVDDHVLFAEVLAARLIGEGDIRVDLAGSYEAAETKLSAAGAYDVILLDLGMPDMSGMCLLNRVIELSGGVPVAVLSGELAPGTIAEAMRRGAASCFVKKMSVQSLIRGIRFLAEGERFLSAELLSAFEPARPQLQNFSPAELAILRGLQDGQTNKEIARELGLSDVTVKTQVRAICVRLGAKNRTHAAMLSKEFDLSS